MSTLDNVFKHGSVQYLREGYLDAGHLSGEFPTSVWYIKNHDVDRNFIASYPMNIFSHSVKLDPNKDSNGYFPNDKISIPELQIPASTSGLGSSSITNLAEVQEIKDLADELKNLPSNQFDTGLDLASINNKVPNIPNANLGPLPDLNLDKDALKKLIEDSTYKSNDVEPVENSTLTTRSVDGNGAFDWFNKAIVNQIEYSVNNGLVDKSSAKDLLIAIIPQTLQTAVSFVIENNKAVWANELVKAQINQAKADLILAPTKLALAQAQLETERQKVNLINTQVELEKLKLPESIARTQQIVEQTKLTNAQSKAALKDIKLKEAQLIKLEADIKIQAEQLVKEQKQTELMSAQIATAYANISLLSERLKAAKAQYSDTIDGEPVGGVLGAQMKVNKAQVMGFERDSFYKFFTQIQSGWSTKKTSDVATLSPSAFTALGLDRAIKWYGQTYFNMPADIFEMPDGYKDYLSEDALNGDVATPSPEDSK